MSTGIGALVFTLLSVMCAAVLIAMFRSGRFLRGAFLTALQGIAALSAVNVLGMVSGVTLSINWLSLGAGLVCGTPGIAALVIVDTIFKL